MGSSNEYFAGPSDDQALRRFAETIGLRVVNIRIDNSELNDASRNPMCYFTFLPSDELHPLGPKRLISSASDPVIEFTRSFCDGEDIVAGRIYWSDDVEEFGHQTKGYFRKVVSWIRRSWSRRNDGYYAGPEAMQLIENELFIARYMKRGVAIRQIEI